ncbi:Kelch-like protein 13 [Nymphon striatum]|nr:Kelch-like protein 13 [Nymphon striatum]
MFVYRVKRGRYTARGYLVLWFYTGLRHRRIVVTVTIVTLLPLCCGGKIMKGFSEKSHMDLNSSSAQFECSSHDSLLVKGLNVLRNRNLLFDVTLIAGGDAFKAHRVVLASCSEYFRAMFTDAMMERTMPEIYLNGISREGLRYILDFVYTSSLKLSLCNIQDVLSAASHVQLTSVIDICCQFLRSKLDLENCVDIAIISETYSLYQLKKYVYTYICSNLKEFCCTSGFKQLTPSQLKYILCCEYPVDCAETEVLSAVLNWIADDKPNRISSGIMLLTPIHFHQLPQESVSTFLDSIIFSEISATCSQNDLVDFLECNKKKSINACELTNSKVLINARGMELALLKVGGFSIKSGMTNEITYFLPSIGKWRYLTSIPHLDQCDFGATVYNNKLYVIGGCFNQSLQENVHPFGFVYNPIDNSWTTTAPMQNSRCRFSLTVVDQCIYAVGGIGESDEDQNVWEDYSPCEVFNPAINRWDTIASIPGWRSRHSSCAWRNYLYVCGGLDHDFTLSSCLRYDLSENSWKELEPMLHPRADHVMLTYKDKIYVCGGWCAEFEDDPESRVLIDSMDCYDIIKDVWTVETFLPTPRYHAGIALVNGVIHITGGFLGDATFDRGSSVIECYDIEAKEWFTMEKYPYEVWEHTCCSLFIPTCREDVDIAVNDP